MCVFEVEGDEGGLGVRRSALNADTQLGIKNLASAFYDHGHLDWKPHHDKRRSTVAMLFTFHLYRLEACWIVGRRYTHENEAARNVEESTGR